MLGLQVTKDDQENGARKKRRWAYVKYSHCRCWRYVLGCDRHNGKQLFSSEVPASQRTPPQALRNLSTHRYLLAPLILNRRKSNRTSLETIHKQYIHININQRPSTISYQCRKKALEPSDLLRKVSDLLPGKDSQHTCLLLWIHNMISVMLSSGMPTIPTNF